MRSAVDDQPEPATRTKTALLGLELGRNDHASIAFIARKEFAFEQRLARVGQPNVKIEVFTAEGRSLGINESHVRLCECAESGRHVEGDVEVPHETTALVKVPWQSRGEWIRVYRSDDSGGWREVLSQPLPGGDT